MSGLTGRTPAALEYEKGRVTLTVKDVEVFNVALGEVREVKFPWHTFGGGMRLTIHPYEYTISFTEPGDQGSIADARSAGKAWNAIFKA